MQTIRELVETTAVEYANDAGDARILDFLVASQSENLLDLFQEIIRAYRGIKLNNLQHTITSLLNFCLRYIKCLEHFIVLFNLVESALGVLSVDQHILESIFYKLLELVFYDHRLLTAFSQHKGLAKNQSKIIQKTLDNILLLWRDLIIRDKFQVLVHKFLKNERKFYRRATIENRDQTIFSSLANIKCMENKDACLHVIKDSLIIRVNYPHEEYLMENLTIKIVLLHKFKNKKQYKVFRRIYDDRKLQNVKSARKIKN